MKLEREEGVVGGEIIIEEWRWGDKDKWVSLKMRRGARGMLKALEMVH